MPDSPPLLTLILGGQNSGKSLFAEERVVKSGLDPFYLATAQFMDEDLKARIHQHQKRRGHFWTLIEEPYDLEQKIAALARPGRILLVDCLTLWLSNWLIDRSDELENAVGNFISFLGGYPQMKENCPLVVVSNEVGLGGISDNRLSNRFSEWQGHVNQEVAKLSSEVLLIVAGLPQILKADAREGARA